MKVLLLVMTVYYVPGGCCCGERSSSVSSQSVSESSASLSSASAPSASSQSVRPSVSEASASGPPSSQPSASASAPSAVPESAGPSASVPQQSSSPSPPSAPPSSSVAVPSSSLGPIGPCCDGLTLPPELGLFLTCATATQTNGDTWAPPQTQLPPVGPGPPPTGGCPACASSPGTWNFQGGGFLGTFFGFNGFWTLIQLEPTSCKWASDPADPYFATFVVNANCTVTLTLRSPGNLAFIPAGVAVYKGTLGAGCDCCSPVKVVLSSVQTGTVTGGAELVPPSLILKPLGCQQQPPTPPASGGAASASASGCECSPDEACLVLQSDGSYAGVGAASGVGFALACSGNDPTAWTMSVTVNGFTETYSANGGFGCDPFSLLFFNVVGPCGEWHAVISTDTSPCGSSSSSGSSSASSVAGCSCLPLGSPVTLYATVINLSGCGSMFASYQLTWNPIFTWTNTVGQKQSGAWVTLGSPQCNSGGTIIVIAIGCDDSTNRMVLISWDAGTSTVVPVPASSVSCTPVMVIWNELGVAECCSGTVELVVTA
jgi:hypothetical protein